MAGGTVVKRIDVEIRTKQIGGMQLKQVSKSIGGLGNVITQTTTRTKNYDSVMSKVVTSFKSFHMELLGLGFGFAMIGMIFSQFVMKALNEYLKLTKFGDALGMSWLNMQGAIRTLGYHVISFAEDTLKGMFDGVEKAIEMFMDWDASVGGAASSTLVLVGAVALVLSPLAFFGLFLFSVGQLLIKTITFMGVLTTAAGGLKASLLLLGAAAFVALGAFQFFTVATDILGQKSGEQKKKVDSLSTALGFLNWVMSLVIVASGGLIYGIWTTAAVIAAAVKTIMRVGTIWVDAYSAVTIALTNMFKAIGEAAVGMWTALTTGKMPSRAIGAMRTFAAATSIALFKLKKATDVGSIWTEEIGNMKSMLDEATGASSAFGQSMQAALRTLSGGTTFPGIQQQVTATTQQIGAATGVPGGLAGMEMPVYPELMETFLKEGMNVAVEVNNYVETDAQGNITVRSEVLTSDEQANTTLNQAGVRA